LADDATNAGEHYFPGQCLLCQSGGFSSERAGSCDACPTGKTQPATGQPVCETCLTGTIAATAFSCTACASGLETSNTAGTECICSSGHYLGNEGSCEACLENADCAPNDERLDRLNLDPDYWR